MNRIWQVLSVMAIAMLINILGASHPVLAHTSPSSYGQTQGGYSQSQMSQPAYQSGQQTGQTYQQQQQAKQTDRPQSQTSDRKQQKLTTAPSPPLLEQAQSTLGEGVDQISQGLKQLGTKLKDVLPNTAPQS